MKNRLIQMIVSSLLFAMASLHAEENASSLEKQLKYLEKASQIMVVTYGRNPWNGELIRDEGERYEGNNLLKAKGLGCNYVSESKVSITKLKEILQRHRLRVGSYSYLSHVGVAIYIDYIDGQKGYIYLGRQHLGESTIDAEVTLTPNTTPQQAILDANIYRALFIWMRESSEVRMGKSPYSPSDVQRHYEICIKSADPNFYRKSFQQKCSSSNENWRLPDECPSGWKPESRD